MNNGNRTSLNKIRLNKIYSKLFFSNLKTQLLLFFTTLFFISKAQLQINLVVKGQGNQNILGYYYSSTPSKIQVVDQRECQWQKNCQLDQDLNKVIVIFKEPITSCLNMFNGLSNIIEINLSNLTTSKVTDMTLMFNGCEGLEKITFGNIDTSLVEKMHCMFQNCKSLKSLDLSKFNTSKVIDMSLMFNGCEKLEEIILGNINTSLVKNMHCMFQNCKNLSSLDVSNFDTSSVTNMGDMFNQCELLISLDVSKFNTSNVENMYDMFGHCNSLVSVDVSNFDTSKVKNMQGMFYICHSLKSIDLSNFKFDSVTNMKSMFTENVLLEFINLYNFKIKNDITLEGIFASTSSNLRICINDIDTQNRLRAQGVKFDCSNICINNSLKIDLKYNICVEYCNESDYKYDIYCYDKCPNTTYILKNNEKICLDKIIGNGYYFDENEEVFKECYKNCKSCNEEGNEINNKCIECKSNFTFLNDSLNDKNCYKICPENYNKLIKQKNKCIDECKNDNIFIYEYNNICFDQIQDISSIITENLTNYITDRFTNLETESEQHIEELKYLCSNDDILTVICFFEDINNNSEIYNIIENQLIYEYSKENKKSQIIKGVNDIIFQITTDKNELELIMGNISLIDNYNLSIIDLGECEIILRDEYNISDEDSLIYVKQQKLEIKSSQQDIKFEVFEPYNKTKLNLSLCSETKINIYVKLGLSDEIKILNEQMASLGYNMFDKNDPFYKDICIPYTSSDNTDMLLSDRIDFIYYNNDAQCQSNCQFIGYILNNAYINCSCNVNNIEENNIKTEKFSIKKLYESYFDVLKYSNYKILKCYELILDIDIITKNKGGIIIIIYFIIYLSCLIVFMIKGIIPFKNKLKEYLKKFEAKNLVNNNIKKDSKKELNAINNAVIKKPKSKNNMDNPPRKKRNSMRKKNQKHVDIAIYQKNIINRKTNFEIQKRPKYIAINKRKDSSLVDIHNGLIKDSFNINLKQSKKRLEIIPLEEEKADNNQNILDDFELNQLEYDEAIKYDKRTFIEIYFSLLKREHKILFTFFICNDYNLFYIKLSRFIFLVATDMAMNAFFFSDETMHKLFLSYGKYDVFQQIPQIVYSTIISQLMEVFICFLSLTDSHIYQIKKLKPNSKNKSIIDNTYKCIKIKLVNYFLFTSVLFLFYWYIIVIFCALYKNTQVSFIKDTLFSFLISILLPFVLYLIPSILRVLAIRNKKNQLKCIYKLSDIIPFF